MKKPKTHTHPLCDVYKQNVLKMVLFETVCALSRLAGPSLPCYGHIPTSWVVITRFYALCCYSHWFVLVILNNAQLQLQH